MEALHLARKIASTSASPHLETPPPAPTPVAPPVDVSSLTGGTPVSPPLDPPTPPVLAEPTSLSLPVEIAMGRQKPEVSGAHWLGSAAASDNAHSLASGAPSHSELSLQGKLQTPHTHESSPHSSLPSHF